MSESARQLGPGWRGPALPLGSHVCCYYADEATLRRTLDFIRVGLETPGELCVLFADRTRHAQLLEWLAADDLDVAGHLAADRLVCVGEASDADALASNIVTALDKGMAAGFTAIRLLGFIAWGTPGWPDDAALLDFEDKVNDVVATYPAVVVCTYGVSNLGGSQLIEGGLGSHSGVMIGDTPIKANPHFQRSK